MIEVHVLKASLKFELLLLEFLLNWMLPLSARKNKQENWMLYRSLSKIEGQLPQPQLQEEKSNCPVVYSCVGVVRRHRFPGLIE
jgi:hypothetical protein